MSLNSLLDKAISVANVAGKKTEEMVEASKLKLQEVSVNADLQDCYEKIAIIHRYKKNENPGTYHTWISVLFSSATSQ